MIVAGTSSHARYHELGMTEASTGKKPRSRKTSRAKTSREPATTAAAPRADNRVMIALIAGFIVGGATVFMFGRYTFVSTDHYQQLVERAADNAKTPAAPTAPLLPAALPNPGGPGPGPGGPPPGGPAALPTNKLVGPKHSVDYPGSATKGSAKAKIIVAVFSDFECPACAQWAPNISQMMTAFQGKLRFVFKHMPLPFHPKAKPAAIAAEAAGKQGKFWQMHDLLFKNQSSLERATFIKLATDLGLDRAQFEKDLDDKQLVARVDRDFGEANRAAIPGTPTFYVNGQRADIGDPNSLHALLNDVVSGK